MPEDRNCGGCDSFSVMAWLDPAIHAFLSDICQDLVPGTSPGMTGLVQAATSSATPHHDHRNAGISAPTAAA